MPPALDHQRSRSYYIILYFPFVRIPASFSFSLILAGLIVLFLSSFRGLEILYYSSFKLFKLETVEHNNGSEGWGAS